MRNLPSKGIRQLLIDGLNLWLQVPEPSIERIRKIIVMLHTSALMYRTFYSAVRENLTNFIGWMTSKTNLSCDVACRVLTWSMEEARQSIRRATCKPVPSLKLQSSQTQSQCQFFVVSRTRFPLHRLLMPILSQKKLKTCTSGSL